MLVESRIRGNVYVRFGGECLETYHRNMAWRRVLSLHKDLSEKGFYNRIISGNINQTIQIDSVTCNLDVYPYQVTTYGRQMIIRESNITERNLITTCRLLNSVRSDNNPHGFTIEAFEIRENKDLRVLDR